MSMQVGDFFPDLLFLLALLCIDGKKKKKIRSTINLYHIRSHIRALPFFHLHRRTSAVVTDLL